MRLLKFDDWESQIIEITGSNLSKILVLGNIYRPTRGNINDYSTLIEEFTELLRYFEKSKCEAIFAGDYNINLLEIERRDIIRNYFNAITSECYFPLITLPTRFSTYRGTLIDNFISKVSELMTSTSGRIISKLSDHQPYFTCLNLLKKQNKPNKYIKVCKKPPDSTNQFREELRSSNINDLLDITPSLDPNENYNIC